MKSSKVFPAFCALIAVVLIACIGCGSPAAPVSSPAASATPTATATPPAPIVTPAPTPVVAPAETEMPESKLWIKIAEFETEAELISTTENKEGVRADTYSYEDNVRIAIERVEPTESGVEAIVKRTAEWEDIDQSEIEPEEDAVTTESLTYPAYRMFYMTGSGSSSMWNVDLYIQTDLWDFRVHTATPLEMDEVYIEQIIGWFYRVEFVE